MTAQEYFNDHIPHRVNLLLTFSERFSETKPNYVNPNEIRDLYRCSKDISMMMVRFLLGELGIRLGKGDEDISETSSNKFVQKLLVRELINDKMYHDVLRVLKAANRAIAHLNDIDVNHPLLTDRENSILFAAIEYTATKVKTNMYDYSKKYDYDAIMSHPNNNMERKTILIQR